MGNVIQKEVGPESVDIVKISSVLGIKHQVAIVLKLFVVQR